MMTMHLFSVLNLMCGEG